MRKSMCLKRRHTPNSRKVLVMLPRNTRVSLKPGKLRATLTITNSNAGGIDIGSAAHLNAMPAEQGDTPVRELTGGHSHAQ